MMVFRKTCIHAMTVFIVVFFSCSPGYSSGTVGLNKSKTSALHGRLWDGLGNNPIAKGFVFALDSSKQKVLGFSESHPGIGPDAGKWQILRLPPSGEVWLVGLHPKIKTALAVKNVKLTGGYQDVKGLVTSMQIPNTVPASGPKDAAGIFGIIELIASEISRVSSEKEALAFADFLLNHVETTRQNAQHPETAPENDPTRLFRLYLKTIMDGSFEETKRLIFPEEGKGKNHRGQNIDYGKNEYKYLKKGFSLGLKLKICETKTIGNWSEVIVKLDQSAFSNRDPNPAKPEPDFRLMIFDLRYRFALPLSICLLYTFCTNMMRSL